MGSLYQGLVGGNNNSAYQAQNVPIIDPLTGQAQTSVNSAQNTIAQQQALASALANAGGIGNQQQSYNQLGNIGNQYSQIAQGQGPNPAQALLSQQTGQNVANQAALQASQRGASNNPALLARQAAQAGAGIQQNQVGQAATLQSQQQLGALGAQAGIAGQQAGIAGQQIGNQLAAQNSLTSAQQQQSGQLIGSNTALNQANLGNIEQQNTNNVKIANTNAQGQQNLLGNVLGAAGAALQAHGGEIVKNYDAGGDVTQSSTGPSSAFGKYITNFNSPQQQQPIEQAGQSQNALASPWGSSIGKGLKNILTPSATTKATPGINNLNDFNTSQGAGPSTAAVGEEGLANVTSAFAKGGKVPAMLSPGEKVLGPKEAQKAKAGNKNPMQMGRVIKGTPRVGGSIDTEANDTIPQNLSEGSIVLPRSVTQSRNPGMAAKRFVEALNKKNK